MYAAITFCSTEASYLDIYVRTIAHNMSAIYLSNCILCIIDVILHMQYRFSRYSHGKHSEYDSD